jgi:hypothetical protein
MVLDYLVFKEYLFAVKGGPNPGPRHLVRLNRQKLPLHMGGFWRVGLFCQNATRIMDPYFQYFSSNSSELTITKISKLLQSRIVQYN